MKELHLKKERECSKDKKVKKTSQQRTSERPLVKGIFFNLLEGEQVRLSPQSESEIVSQIPNRKR